MALEKRTPGTVLCPQLHCSWEGDCKLPKTKTVSCLSLCPWCPHVANTQEAANRHLLNESHYKEGALSPQDHAGLGWKRVVKKSFQRSRC